MPQRIILYRCAKYTGTVLQKYPLTFVPARVQKNIVRPTQSKEVFCSMMSERSRVEYCSVAVSVPVVSDVEPSFLIDSQWSGSRATVGRINYLMKKNWLRTSDAQKKEMRFSLQIMTLYGLEDKRFTSHMQRDFLFWRIQQPKVVNYEDYFGQCALRAQAD